MGHTIPQWTYRRGDGLHGPNLAKGKAGAGQDKARLSNEKLKLTQTRNGTTEKVLNCGSSGETSRQTKEGILGPGETGGNMNRDLHQKMTELVAPPKGSVGRGHDLQRRLSHKMSETRTPRRD